MPAVVEPMTTPATPPAYRVTAFALHVRAAPAVSSEVVGYLHKGELVERLGISHDGYWLHVRRRRADQDLVGWSSHKFLDAVVLSLGGKPDPPWLAIALAERGTREVRGGRDNPRIVEYLRSTNLRAPLAADDETPWCSAFVNWCVERSGFEGTDSAWARSWLSWGRTLEQPSRGCITVLDRGPGSGHVGFFVGEKGRDVELLGGNQRDAVTIATFPRDRVLGHRLPG